MLLLSVVSQRGGHAEAHVTVLAKVRPLSSVQPHVVLQGGVSPKLGTALLTGERPLIEVLRTFVVEHT